MDPQPQGLNNLDYCVLGTILASGLLALIRGFIREVLSLVAWAAAYFAAAKYYPLAEPFAHRYLNNPTAVTAAAGAAIFLGVLIILTIIFSIVGRFLRSHLNMIDRSLGFLFGLLRGVLIVCIIYLSVLVMWPDTDKPPDQQDPSKMPPEWVMVAKTRPAMDYGANLLRDFVPQKEAEATAQKYQKYIQEQYLEQRAKAQHLIDQENLDRLSTPAIAGGKESVAPTYDDKSRSGLNQLINQGGKP